MKNFISPNWQQLLHMDPLRQISNNLATQQKSSRPERPYNMKDWVGLFFSKVKLRQTVNWHASYSPSLSFRINKMHGYTASIQQACLPCLPTYLLLAIHPLPFTLPSYYTDWHLHATKEPENHELLLSHFYSNTITSTPCNKHMVRMHVRPSSG